jgi:hypothetical protein
MALVTEDGTGLAGAESFCSVSFADTYLGNFGYALWATMSTTEKEQALRRATLYMQQVYRMRWAGDRVTTTQALDWPRVGVPRRDVGSWGAWGYYGGFASEYASNVVPAEVQQACAKMAYKAAAGDLSPDLSQAKTRVKVGPIETEYAAGSTQYVRYREIDNLLSPFMKMGGGMIPVSRA